MPRFLKDNGIRQIIAPLLNKSRDFTVEEDGLSLKLVILADDTGDATKQYSVQGFMKLFSKDDMIEAALQTVMDV